jgi:hypothetical protein
VSPSDDGNMAKGKHSSSSAGRGRARSGGKRPRSANTHTRRGLLADTSSAGDVSDVAREPDGNEDATRPSTSPSFALILPLIPSCPRCPDHCPSGNVG